MLTGGGWMVHVFAINPTDMTASFEFALQGSALLKCQLFDARYHPDIVRR
jgi:hypothetical protein